MGIYLAASSCLLECIEVSVCLSVCLSINTSDSKNSVLLPSQRKGIANTEHVRNASVPHVVTKYHLLIRQCAKCIVVCDSEEFDHKSSILNLDKNGNDFFFCVRRYYKPDILGLTKRPAIAS